MDAQLFHSSDTDAEDDECLRRHRFLPPFQTHRVENMKWHEMPRPVICYRIQHLRGLAADLLVWLIFCFPFQSLRWSITQTKRAYVSVLSRRGNLVCTQASQWGNSVCIIIQQDELRTTAFWLLLQSRSDMKSSYFLCIKLPWPNNK